MYSLTKKRFSQYYLLALCSLLLVLVFTATALVITRPAPAQAAPAATKLSLTFTCAQAVDYQSGRVCVHTQANAALTIKVTYCTGRSAVSNSLKGTQHANSGGNHTWTWTPETKCRGQATALVTEHFKGHSLSKSHTFTVK